MIQVNGFLLRLELNTNKIICQKFFKESEPEELVFLYLHFGINLQLINSGNTENEFVLSKTITFFKNCIKNFSFEEFFNNINNDDKRYLHNEINS